MIGRLSGTLLQSTTTDVLLDVGGVAYELSIPLSTFDKLPHEGSPCVLYVHTQVREDAITLYGFAAPDEKSLFRILIGATGIGGKLALNILGAMPIDNFCAAILGADVKALSCINGVGKRTAERLIVELKNRIAEFNPAAANSVNSTGNAAYNDALSALQALGYSREAAAASLNSVIAEKPEKTDCETLIRLALVGMRR